MRALEVFNMKDEGYGIVAFCSHLIRGQSIPLDNGATFTGKTLREEFNRGGKDHLQTKWRVSANTHTGHSAPTIEYEGEASGADRDSMYEEEFFHGQHEWIPTNMLGYVIDWAMHYGEIRWLQLADILRTATKNVILKPTNGKLVAGHVGALYVPKLNKYSALTKGQAGFHDGLRKILTDNLGPAANSIDGYEKELLIYIGKTCWDGLELHGKCPYYFPGPHGYVAWGEAMSNSNAQVISTSFPTSSLPSSSSLTSGSLNSSSNLTMENMSRAQKKEWDDAMAAMRNQFRALKTQPVPIEHAWSNNLAAQQSFPVAYSDDGGKDVQMKH